MTTPIVWQTELEEAVLMALAAWLGSAPAGLGPTTGNPLKTTILTDWPEASRKLVYPTITVLRAGAPEVELLDVPIPVGSTFLVGNQYAYEWRTGQAKLPLQLDVWAESKAMRGDVLKRLRDAMTAPKTLTLAAYFATLTPPGPPAMQPPFENEIVLQLAPPWASILCGYTMAHEVRLEETPRGASEKEWRATLTGFASYDVTKTVKAPGMGKPTLQLTASTNAVPNPQDDTGSE